MLKKSCAYEPLAVLWRPREEGQSVADDPASDFVIISEQGVLQYHDGEQSGVLVHSQKRRILCAAFVDRSTLVTGDDCGDLTFWDWNSTDPLRLKKGAHDIRIKAVGSIPCDPASPFKCVVSSSSDGFIRLWHVKRSDTCRAMDDEGTDFSASGKSSGLALVLVGEEQTGGRITCLAAGPHCGQ